MRHYKLLALAFGVFLIEASPALAAAQGPMTDAELREAVFKLTAQSQELQQEVRELKAELRQVRTSGRVKTTPTSGPVAPKAVVPANNVPMPNNQVQAGDTNQQLIRPVISSAGAPLPPRLNDYTVVTTEGVALNEQGKPILSVEEEISQEREADITYLMGAYVMSSQVLNIHSSYDASDLLVNQSTMNEDLRFLQQRQELQQIIGYENLPSASRPRIFLSGRAEGMVSYVDPYNGAPASNNIALGSAELAALGEASPWAFGFLSLDYDSSTLNPLLVGSGNPVYNSNVFLNRGFIVIGNLDKSPVYFSAGQEYVPFGRYVAFQLSNPVTKLEGRINTHAAVLGYYKNGLYIAGYGFDGAVNFDNRQTIDEWGGNIGYKHASPDGFFNIQFGAGFVNNIAEAQGYQLTGNSEGFQGFAIDSATENLLKRVPGADVHASFGAGPFSMFGEYVAATESFDWMDITFDNKGAKPSGGHIEGDYNFKIFNKPSSFTLAYEHTWESLPLNLPQNSYIAAFNTSIWKNTIQSLEFRHDKNYSTNNSSGGICDPDLTGNASYCLVQSVGGSQNSLLAQVGVYF